MKHFKKIKLEDNVSAPAEFEDMYVELADDHDIKLNIAEGVVRAPIRIFRQDKDGKKLKPVHIRTIDVDLSGGKAEAQQGKITVNEESLEQKIFKML